jgi:hypothetical protein
MLPQKYLDRVSGRFERLAVFKGSLALNICILYTKCLIKCLNVFLCQLEPENRALCFLQFNPTSSVLIFLMCHTVNSSPSPISNKVDGKLD